MIETLAGILFALSAILFTRAKKAEAAFFAFGLMTLPVIYMVFGFFATEKNTVVMELVFGVPFLCGAILALKCNAKWCLILLAAFWLVHAGYDIFHDQWLINSAVFPWYPALCAAVDVTIGAYLLYLLYLASKRVKPSNISA